MTHYRSVNSSVIDNLLVDLGQNLTCSRLLCSFSSGFGAVGVRLSHDTESLFTLFKPMVHLFHILRRY